MGDEQDGDVHRILPADGDVTLFPEVNSVFPGYLQDPAKFTRLVGLLYNTLERRINNQREFVYCNFLNHNDVQIQAFKELNINGIETLTAHPLSLFRLTSTVINTNINLTRQLRDAIFPLFRSADVNTLILQRYQSPNDNQEDQNQVLLLSFIRLMRVIRDVIAYQATRVRYLMECLCCRNQLNISLPIAEASYQELLMSLTTRNESHELILKAAQDKKTLVSLLGKVQSSFKG